MPLTRQAVMALATALTAALTAAACSTSGLSHAASRPAKAAPSSTRVVVTTGRVPWRLPAPVSRLVALPDGAGVLLAGGLDASDVSGRGIDHLDLATGELTRIGTLAHPVHDAAGARLSVGVVIFGGGTAGSTAAVQRFDVSGSARDVGHLPQPRSDLSAVTLGGRAFLLGGYTGYSQPASVLETTDGATFRIVTRLPVAVRYAAVTAVGATIWVFGGSHDGHPVRDIQRIDTRTGDAQVVGLLPTPLSDAAAMVVAGEILLAGGRTSATHVTDAVYAFDPARAVVRLVAHLPVPVADAGIVVIADTGYLLGGENGSTLALVQTLAGHRVPSR
jgi:hypothetical protein